MKKSKRLSSLLSQLIYKYTLISLLFIIFMIVSLYFVLNISVADRILTKFEESRLTNISNSSDCETKSINQTLEDVRRGLLFLSHEHEEFFQFPELYPIDFVDATFEKHESGAYFKNVDNGGSGLYYSAITPMSDYTMEKALRTEWFDRSLKKITENNNLIVQAYFNSYDSMNRLYPYISNPIDFFTPFMNIPMYNFYYLANEDYNPDRKNIWLEPYYDPAGSGWIISGIAPIYNGDWLEGVTGVDITLNQLSSQVLKSYDEKSFGALLISDNGHMIAYNDNAVKMLNIEPLESFENQVVEKVIMVPKTYNLFNMLDDGQEISMDENKIYRDVTINDNAYIMTINRLEEADWFFVSLFDQNTFGKERINIEKEIQKSMIIVFIVLLFIVVLVTTLYVHRAKKISKQISGPITILSDLAKSFALDTMQVGKPELIGVEEIDSLGREFYLMSNQIRSRTNQLIESQIEKRKAEEAIEFHLKEATTDTLTKVFNRRKFDDTLDNEFKRAKRYQSKFTLFILDIDYFKAINDEYGHTTGDDVLIDIAKILQENVRGSDIVARWGGDEFVILSVETDEEHGLKVANKIRVSVSNYRKNDIQVTTSIGLAEVNIDVDSARTLLLKADEALYEAKKRGRNCAVAYHEIGEKYDRK